MTSPRLNERPTYSPDHVKAAVIQRLQEIEPPIGEIYHYKMYAWKALSHRIVNVRFLGSGKWEVVSNASFEGYHKGLSVGTDHCRLRWEFNEDGRRIQLVENQLLTPEGTQATFSRQEVIAFVGKCLSDMYYDHAKLNWHDTAHWKLNYLGNGKWQIRVVITNAVGLWHFCEDSRRVEFQGRLGP